MATSSMTVDGNHGNLFQKNLFQILFERLSIEKRDFKLAYDTTDAGKFDDVVVYLNNEENINEESWFFQVKHSDTSNGVIPAPLTYKMLFSKQMGKQFQTDFNLYKCLESYALIKKNSTGIKKKLFIFTNRDLLLQGFDGRVEIVSREVDKILDFPGETLGLDVKDTFSTLIEEVQDIVNQNFFALRDGILKLLQCGEVCKKVKQYGTPLAEVLEISENSVRFKPTFTAGSNKPELKRLHEALLENKKDLENIQLPLNRNCKNKKQIDALFTLKSRNQTIPIFVDKDMVLEFFDNLVLFVKQPHNLLPILNDDLQKWIKRWLRPEYFGKLNDGYLETPYDILEVLFNKLIESSVNRKLLQKADGEQCLEKITELDIFKQEEFCPFYINRRFGDVSNVGSGELSDIDFAKEITGKLDNQKFLILSAEPGMGKTTVFQFIAHEAQQMPNRCVFLIYLNEFQQKLQHFESISSLDDVSQVLNEFLSDMHCRKIMNVNEMERLIFFFDAFDEVAVENRDKVLKVLLQLLKISNLQIVVDGRRNVKELLEESFHVEAVRLIPFDRKDQINFLRQFWSVPEDAESIFQAYATHLLDLFHSTKNRALNEFTGLPFSLTMLATVNTDGFKEYLKSNENDKNILLNQNIVGIVDLYESFIEQSFIRKMLKISTNWKPESQDYTSELEKFKLQHQLLAMEKLNQICWQEFTQNPAFKSEYDDFVDSILQRHDKTPLVDVVENQIQFVHLSCAEYFVAQFMYINIEKFKHDLFNANLYSWKINSFYSDNFKMVRRFYFAIVESKQDIKHLEILRQSFETERDIRSWIFEVSGCNTVKELVKGFDGKVKRELANEVLVEAAQYDEICQSLMTTFGADLDVNFKSRSGETALLVAAGVGNTEVMRYLIGKDADINCIDFNGDTPLHLAIRMYHPSVLELLLEYDVNLEIQNESGQTPVQTTILRIMECKSKLENITNKLPKSVDTTSPSDKRYNGYFKMMKGFNEELDFLLKILIVTIKKLKFVKTSYEYKKTLLHDAAEAGVKEAVDLLLKFDVNVNARDYHKQTPLHLATRNNHTDVMESLLMKSADVNAADINKQTPLDIAKKNGFEDGLKLLLKFNDDSESE